MSRQSPYALTDTKVEALIVQACAEHGGSFVIKGAGGLELVVKVSKKSNGVG